MPPLAIRVHAGEFMRRERGARWHCKHEWHSLHGRSLRQSAKLTLSFVHFGRQAYIKTLTASPAAHVTASDPRLKRKQKVEGRKDGDGKEEDIVSSAARADHAAKTFCGRRSRMSEGRMELRRGGGVCLHLSICLSIRRPEYGFHLSLSPSCSGRRARA